MAAQVDLTINTKANTAELTKATEQAQEFIDTIKLGVGIDLGEKLVEGVGEIGAQFKDGVVEGVKFNSTIQDAQLAIAAMLKSFQPEKFHTLDDAMAASAKGVAALKQAALDTPFTFETLLESLQGISGPLAEGGVKDLQKQVDLVTLLSQAAKTLNIPQQQFQPDARDLVSGRIGRTLLGRSLGITDDDINQAKKQGDLYEFLTQKLSAYGEAGTKSLDNLSTRASNLYDKFQQLEGTSTQGIFDQINSLAKDLGDAVSAPDFQNTAQTIGSEISVITGAVTDLIRVVADHPAIFAALAQGTAVFATSLAFLNLPRLVLGLTQIATTAVPALANLASLTSAVRDESKAVTDSTAQLDANTASLKANAEASDAAGGSSRNFARDAQGRFISSPADNTVADATTSENTDASDANTAAITSSTDATTAANAVTEESNALTEESTAVTEANTLSTEANTTAISASNAAAVSNNQETLSSNELTDASTAVTDVNTASTASNTAAINESNAAAVANNAETISSNALTEQSTAVTDANTSSTERSNAAASEAIAIGEKEEVIATAENELTAQSSALDDTATDAVLRSNAAGAQAIAIGKQEIAIVTKENLLTDESTAKTILNTSAVKQSNQVNTEAVEIGQQQVALEESETAATQSHASEVAVDTAAIEANTAAKAENASVGAEASAVPAETAAGGSSGKILSAGNISAALTAVLSIGQVYVAYEGYVDQINQANAGLSTQLDTQLGTLRQQVDTVSTQGDKEQLIATLKDQQQRTEAAIETTRASGLETNSQTLQILQQYQSNLETALVKTEGISNAQLDVRSSTQKAASALEQELQALGKLTDGFDKANIKYKEFLATQQATQGSTFSSRLQGNANIGAAHLAALNQPLTVNPFSSNDDVVKFLSTADSQRAELTKASTDAGTAATAAVKNLQASQIAVAKAQSDLDAANATATGSVLLDIQKRQQAIKALDAAKAQEQQATENKSTTAQAVSDASNNLRDFDGRASLAEQQIEQQKNVAAQRIQIVKEQSDSDLKLTQEGNKAIQSQNERDYKDQLISLQQYLATARSLIEREHQAELTAISNDGNLTDDQKSNASAVADIKFQAASSGLQSDARNKTRQENVQNTQEQARQISQQADNARASGNIDLAEQLDEQVSKLQKYAEIQGRIGINDQQRKQLMDEVSASMDKQFNTVQAQKDAETSLETQEKLTADSLSHLQAQQQLINSSNALPDAKNDALRQNVLEQNQILEQQVQLLEQRRQLALADPTKSPNDRALAAAQIQQQEDQTKAQIVGNQITADKLTFTGQFTNDLATFASSFGSTAQQAAGVITGTLGTAVSSISSHLTAIVEGTESVKEGFIAMAQEVVGSLIQLAIKLAITLALQEALDVAGVASAPAAGAAAGTLAAGLATAGSVGGFAEGGLVPGTPSHSDNRIATIASGEYVARTAAVNHYGPGLFEALNNMAIPRHALTDFDMPVRARTSIGFADGGLVAPLPFIAPTAPSRAASNTSAVHVGFLNDRASTTAWARQGDGRKVIVDLIDGRLKDLGFAS